MTIKNGEINHGFDDESQTMHSRMMWRKRFQLSAILLKI